MTKGPHQSELAKWSAPIFDLARGHRFELARMRLLLTQEQMAKRLSTESDPVNQQAIHALEKGKTRFARFTCEQLLGAVGPNHFEYIMFNKHSAGYIERLIRAQFFKAKLAAKQGQKKRGNPYRSERERLQKTLELGKTFD